jgi:hypothetical protein
MNKTKGWFFKPVYKNKHWVQLTKGKKKEKHTKEDKIKTQIKRIKRDRSKVKNLKHMNKIY